MESTIYGMVAEFSSEAQIVNAAKKTRAEGYNRIEAYTPLPVHGLAEIIGLDIKDTLLPWIIFLAGVSGMIAGFGLEWWVNLIEYPLNVGGRPLNSWVQFIPISYECTILFAAGAAVVGMLALNGLPRPHHPIFNANRFERASNDRFFLCIEATDAKFDIKRTAAFLTSLDAIHVSEVED